MANGLHKWSGSNDNVFALSDLARGQVLPPPALFGDLMLDDTLTMISAPPYSGKSLLLAAMVVSLDTGLPLFGRFAPNGVKKVLTLLQDAPTWDYAEQFRKICRGYGLSKEQMELLDAQLIINRGLQLTDPEFMNQLRVWYGHSPFDVLCLDALWTFHSFNENDNSQMAFVMAQLKRIRTELGAAVIFTHHTAKLRAEDAGMDANYRSRGATVIPASVDFHFAIKRSGNRILLQTPKGRGADVEQIVPFDIVEVDHPDGMALKFEARKPEENRQGKLLEFMAEPRKREDLIAFVRAEDPKLTEARAKKAVDNDLQLLRAYQKVERVGYGIWKAVK